MGAGLGIPVDDDYFNGGNRTDRRGRKRLGRLAGPLTKVTDSAPNGANKIEQSARQLMCLDFGRFRAPQCDAPTFLRNSGFGIQIAESPLESGEQALDLRTLRGVGRQPRQQFARLALGVLAAACIGIGDRKIEARLVEVRVRFERPCQ